MEWTGLGWSAVTPGSSAIVFTVETGESVMSLGSFIKVGEARIDTQQCLVQPASGCYVDLVKELNGVDAFDGGLPTGPAVNPVLYLDPTLIPDSGGGPAAALTCWQLTYDCPFVQ